MLILILSVYDQGLIENAVVENYNDLYRLKQTMEDAMAVLEESEEYIKKVMSGEIKPSSEVIFLLISYIVDQS